MSSINRPLAGPSMKFDLAGQLAELRQEEAYGRSGRAGRTLAKSGRFRLTLLAVGEGVLIGTHQADSPMTLQVLEGGLQYRDEGGTHELRQGELLFFGPGNAEDIRATADSALLLTLSAVGDDYVPEESEASAAGPRD
jgi:quercetin dioxygenase-like cupin family protein